MRLSRQLVAALALGGIVGLVATAAVGAQRLLAPVASPVLVVRRLSERESGAAGPAIPLPTTGSFAVWDSFSGSVAAVNAAAPVPIASLTKTMTALVALHDLPLAPGAAGPSYTVTAADVAATTAVITDGGSFVPVTAGEQLTERDVLLGMMLPSANNYAVIMSRWAAGSQTAFEAQMNSQAAAWGMRVTHFADVDGLSSQTVASAADLLTLAQQAIADPTLVEIMAHATASLPGGVVVSNIDPLVGSVSGWLGIKTGFTYAGGYCLLFAARERLAPNGPAVTVVGAVLGQPTRLATFTAAQSAVSDDVADYQLVSAASVRPALTAVEQAPWVANTAVTLGAPSAGRLVVRRGAAASLSLTSVPISAPLTAGAPVGELSLTGLDGTVIRWPLVTVAALPSPSWTWRLSHG